MSDARVTRRRLLTGGAAVLGGATLGGLAVAATTSARHRGAPSSRGASTRCPSAARTSPASTTPQQAHAWFVALDLVEGARPRRARPAARAVDRRHRAAHVGSRGARRPGARAGRRARAPHRHGRAWVRRCSRGSGSRRTGRRRLRPLPAFATDRLDPRWGEADLLLQVGGRRPAHRGARRAGAHARRAQHRDGALDAARLRSRRAAACRAGRRRATCSGRSTARSTRSPAARTSRRVVWATDGPAWWHGGTMLVVRRIAHGPRPLGGARPLDRELVVGRRLADGSPLTGGIERDAGRPRGRRRRRAAGRARGRARAAARAQSPDERFLRRGFTYDDTGDAAGRGADLLRAHGRRRPAVRPGAAADR